MAGSATTPLLDALLTGPLGQELNTELEQVYEMQRLAEDKAQREELRQNQQLRQQQQEPRQAVNAVGEDKDLALMNYLQVKHGEAWQQKYFEMQEQRDYESGNLDDVAAQLAQEAQLPEPLWQEAPHSAQITEERRMELKRKLKAPKWLTQDPFEEPRAKRPFDGGLGGPPPNSGEFNSQIYMQFGTIPRTDPPKLQKTMMCKFFLKGKCTRGTACTFAHGKEELKSKPDFYKTRLCPDFRDTGSCIMGDDCGYAHTEVEIRKPPRPAAQTFEMMMPPADPSFHAAGMAGLMGQHGGMFTPMMQAAVGQHGMPGSSQGFNPLSMFPGM